MNTLGRKLFELLVLGVALLHFSTSAWAKRMISEKEYETGKTQLAHLKDELNWKRTSLILASLIKSDNQALKKFLTSTRKEMASLESEIVHYELALKKWEKVYRRKLVVLKSGTCISSNLRPYSNKLIRFLRSSRQIVEKMKWQAQLPKEQKKKLVEIRESTIAYLNRKAYLVLYKGKEIVKVYKFINIGTEKLATSRTTLQKAGFQLTYQEGNKYAATSTLGQISYLEEIPVTNELLLKIGPSASYRIGSVEKNHPLTKGSMAIMGPTFQMHIKSNYFIGLSTGVGVRFRTAWMRDLIKKTYGGVERAGEMMFHFGMVFPG